VRKLILLSLAIALVACQAKAPPPTLPPLPDTQTPPASPTPKPTATPLPIAIQPDLSKLCEEADYACMAQAMDNRDAKTYLVQQLGTTLEVYFLIIPLTRDPSETPSAFTLRQQAQIYRLVDAIWQIGFSYYNVKTIEMYVIAEFPILFFGQGQQTKVLSHSYSYGMTRTVFDQYSRVGRTVENFAVALNQAKTTNHGAAIFQAVIDGQCIGFCQGKEE